MDASGFHAPCSSLNSACRGAWSRRPWPSPGANAMCGAIDRHRKGDQGPAVCANRPVRRGELFVKAAGNHRVEVKRSARSGPAAILRPFSCEAPADPGDDVGARLFIISVVNPGPAVRPDRLPLERCKPGNRRTVAAGPMGMTSPSACLWQASRRNAGHRGAMTGCRPGNRARLKDLAVLRTEFMSATFCGAAARVASAYSPATWTGPQHRSFPVRVAKATEGHEAQSAADHDRAPSMRSGQAMRRARPQLRGGKLSRLRTPGTAAC